MSAFHHANNKCSSLHHGVVYFTQSAPQHWGVVFESHAHEMWSSAQKVTTSFTPGV